MAKKTMIEEHRIMLQRMADTWERIASDIDRRWPFQARPGSSAPLQTSLRSSHHRSCPGSGLRFA